MFDSQSPKRKTQEQSKPVLRPRGGERLGLSKVATGGPRPDLWPPAADRMDLASGQGSEEGLEEAKGGQTVGLLLANGQGAKEGSEEARKLAEGPKLRVAEEAPRLAEGPKLRVVEEAPRPRGRGWRKLEGCRGSDKGWRKLNGGRGVRGSSQRGPRKLLSWQRGQRVVEEALEEAPRWPRGWEEKLEGGHAGQPGGKG